MQLAINEESELE